MTYRWRPFGSVRSRGAAHPDHRLQGNLDTLQVSTQEDAATLDVVSGELTRMARLVGELTLLARSEQPDFLHPQTAGLGELTRALAAKARALDPAGDQRVTLTSSACGHAVLDPQRITQAVMHLAANAFAHTPPGPGRERGAGPPAARQAPPGRETGGRGHPSPCSPRRTSLTANAGRCWGGAYPKCA